MVPSMTEKETPASKGTGDPAGESTGADPGEGCTGYGAEPPAPPDPPHPRARKETTRRIENDRIALGVKVRSIWLADRGALDVESSRRAGRFEAGSRLVMGGGFQPGSYRFPFGGLPPRAEALCCIEESPIPKGTQEGIRAPESASAPGIRES